MPVNFENRNEKRYCMNSTHVKVTLQEDFLAQYPEASIHALTVVDLNLVGTDLADEWKAKAMNYVATWGIDPQRLVEQPWIAEWRAVMKSMGLNAAKTKSSIEQLAKRALNGSYIATPIPVVNLYCHISVMAQAPMGGYDVARLKGTICVRLARDGDTFLGIGEREPLLVRAPAIVYADDDHVACYAWNHRDSTFTCLTRETNSAIFFADAATRIGRARAATSIDMLAEALSRSGAQVISRGVLDRECMTEEFAVTGL
jgi:DNA/RNA-binding domain of Phe-tRNA-synthetase-like protein